MAKIRFNSVLLNYYRDGNDSVAWHSDRESVLGENYKGLLINILLV